MNINDIKDEIEIPDNIWETIFEHQLKLAEKYNEIEGMGDLLETLDSNIHTAKGQKWIKDFAWRCTEELAEADEALRGGHDEHFKEELIDALHFLTEMTIIAGYKKIDPIYLQEKPDFWEITYELGLMCNCLKNKPWKQSQMMTDAKKFESHLVKAWFNFYTFLHNNGLSDQDIYKIYFKKKEVNKFRIKSKY